MAHNRRSYFHKAFSSEIKETEPKHPSKEACFSIINIEENNRMGNTRDLFKKIRDTKGTFHAKMGSIKDKNGMD